MSATVELLPSKVLAHAERLRELLQIVQSAPIAHVVQAVSAMKDEIEALASSALEAGGGRADVRYSINIAEKIVTFTATSPKGRLFMGKEEGTVALEESDMFRDNAVKAGMTVYAERNE